MLSSAFLTSINPIRPKRASYHVPNTQKSLYFFGDRYVKIQKTGKTGGFSDKTGKNRNEFKKSEKN